MLSSARLIPRYVRVASCCIRITQSCCALEDSRQLTYQQHFHMLLLSNHTTINSSREQLNLPSNSSYYQRMSPDNSSPAPCTLPYLTHSSAGTHNLQMPGSMVAQVARHRITPGPPLHYDAATLHSPLHPGPRML